MVRAWNIEESNLDENKWEISENNRDFVDLENLKKLTGVLYWNVTNVIKYFGYLFELQI